MSPVTIAVDAKTATRSFHLWIMNSFHSGNSFKCGNVPAGDISFKTEEAIRGFEPWRFKKKKAYFLVNLCSLHDAIFWETDCWFRLPLRYTTVHDMMSLYFYSTSTIRVTLDAMHIINHIKIPGNIIDVTATLVLCLLSHRSERCRTAI